MGRAKPILQTDILIQTGKVGYYQIELRYNGTIGVYYNSVQPASAQQMIYLYT